MKRTTLIISLILTLLLSACANSAPAGAAPNPEQPTSPLNTQSNPDSASTTSTGTSAQAAPVATLDESYENAASVEQQLLLGTLKLQGTNLAITKDQASKLLSLWQEIQTKSQSMMPIQGHGNGTAQPQSGNSSNQEQIDALVNQIQASMTADQVGAIAEMKITKQSAMTLMQGLGITMKNPQQGDANNAGNGGNQPPMSNPASNGSEPGSSTGAPPSGGQPSGNGQMPGNGQMAGQPSTGNGMVPPELINAVIQALAKTSGIQLPDSSE